MASGERQNTLKAGAREPIIGSGYTLETVTDKISSIVLTRGTTQGWVFGFVISFGLLMVLNLVVSMLMMKGVGIWGINIPIAWAFAITNFVWWIGIGHAGTLISAIPPSAAPEVAHFDQPLRRSDDDLCRDVRGNVPAAAHGAAVAFLLPDAVPEPDVAVAAVPQPAGVGRIRGIDVLHSFAAVLVRGVDSGPCDAARSRAERSAKKIIYGMLAMGWRGSAVHWSRYEFASLLLAGLATPLVVSVHTVVSFDFAIAIVPGWHSTIFPPISWRARFIPDSRWC